VLHDAEVVAVVGVDRIHRLGLDVRDKELVEALRRLLAPHRTGRGADDVVLDVLRVHRDGSRRVARSLGGDVPLNQLVHLRWLHLRPPVLDPM
jgi:hypothetical protein